MSRQDIPGFFLVRETVSEEIDLLWALRGIDEELVTLNAALQRFPGERTAIEQRLAAERMRLAQAKMHFTELQKKRREIEQKIAGVTETERKFQGQLPLVKKNEEYKALQHEIDAARQQRSDLETQARPQELESQSCLVFPVSRQT